MRQCKTKSKKVRELYLDESFTKEKYNEIMADFQIKRRNMETHSCKSYQKQINSLNQNVSTIFELASHRTLMNYLKVRILKKKSE